MKTRSAKAKGKRLEKLVRDAILSGHPSLTEDDVRVTIGQEGGADIKLSKKAREVLGNLNIECKNRETFKTIYSFFRQAQKHNEQGIPVVIIKMNREDPLVLISFSEWLKTL